MEGLTELAKWILDNNDKQYPGWDQGAPIIEHIYWPLCISGEAGELANAAKKHNRVLRGWIGQGLTWEEYQEKAKDEMGDIFIYLVLYSRILGVPLEEAVKGAIAKNAERYGWNE